MRFTPVQCSAIACELSLAYLRKSAEVELELRLILDRQVIYGAFNSDLDCNADFDEGI
jgi:hypothetical protein